MYQRAASACQRGRAVQADILAAKVTISMFSMRLSLISERQWTGCFADKRANTLPVYPFRL